MSRTASDYRWMLGDQPVLSPFRVVDNHLDMLKYERDRLEEEMDTAQRFLTDAERRLADLNDAIEETEFAIGQLKPYYTVAVSE